MKTVLTLLILSLAGSALAKDKILMADVTTLLTSMDSEQETTSLAGDVAAAAGFGGLAYDQTSGTLTWGFVFSDLTGPVNAVHIHGPAAVGESAPVLLDLAPLSNGLTSPITGSAVVVDQALESALMAGSSYVNLHTDTNPAGEIRGQLVPTQGFSRIVALDPDQETHSVTGDVAAAKGSATVAYDAMAQSLSWDVYYERLTGPAVSGHIHGPAGFGEAAGVLIDLSGGGLASPISGSVSVTDPLIVSYLFFEQAYINLHTSSNSAGEIRGQLLVPRDMLLEAILEPDQEVTPPGGDVSAASGVGVVTYQVPMDGGNEVLSWNITYGGLTDAPVGAHIHGPAGFGVNAPVIVPLSPTASPISGQLVEPDLDIVAHLAAGLTYFNIHTPTNSGGEIRGQLRPILFESGFEEPQLPQPR